MEEATCKLALSIHLGCDINEIIEESEDNLFKVDGNHYLVYDTYDLDDALATEAEKLLEEELKRIPEHLRIYFNEEAFIEDNMTDFDLISNEYYEVEIEEDDFSSMFFIFAL